MTQSVKGIFFDFDGVIVESADLKTEAYRKLFEKEYPGHADAVVEYHLENMGVSRTVKIPYIYENILKETLSPERQGELEKRFADIVVRQVLEVEYVPGAREFLQKNSSRFECFVASGTPQRELEDIVRQRELAPFFKEVHGAPRCKSDIIRDVLRRRGWKAGETVFIGDAESDWRAAKDAGVPFIARAPYPESSLRLKSAYSMIDLTDLEKILGQMERERQNS